MPTFLGKPFSSYFKNLLGINQSSNTGVDSTTRVVHDGAGNSTSISLSDDVLKVQPVNDDTPGALLVKTQSGSNIFAVNTVDSKVLIGASLVAANTQYVYFGIASAGGLSLVAGTHYAVPFGNVLSATVLAMGTGIEPSTSYDISANNSGDDMTMVLWYIPDNITIDQIYWMAGGDSATGDTIADVDSGKVCMVTFESNGTNSNYSINVTVKYHIR
jgi:hypothetical protein